MNTQQRGFTLIELMVVTAVTGILAATAYPSFQAPVFKARRIDGITSLLQLQMSQERWRSHHSSYANLAELGAASRSPMGYYQLDVSETGASGFIAEARSTGTQAGDTGCQVMRLVVADGNTTYASGADAQTTNDSATNRRCWNL